MSSSQLFVIYSNSVTAWLTRVLELTGHMVGSTRWTTLSLPSPPSPPPLQHSLSFHFSLLPLSCACLGFHQRVVVWWTPARGEAAGGGGPPGEGRGCPCEGARYPWQLLPSRAHSRGDPRLQQVVPWRRSSPPATASPQSLHKVRPPPLLPH
jgi:hypothetical protein